MSAAKTEHIPKRYEQLNRPYAGAADATSAINDFFKMVERMRFHIGIPDVVLIVRTQHLETGEPVDSISELFLGDSQINAQMILHTVQKNFAKSGGEEAEGK